MYKKMYKKCTKALWIVFLNESTKREMIYDDCVTVSMDIFLGNFISLQYVFASYSLCVLLSSFHSFSNTERYRLLLLFQIYSSAYRDTFQISFGFDKNARFECNTIWALIELKTLFTSCGVILEHFDGHKIFIRKFIEYP